MLITESERRRITLAEAVSKIPPTSDKRFAVLLEDKSFSVEIYAPRGEDPQRPHTRDEAYIVMQGTGEFISGDSRHPFGPGDFLFVPARVEHRFVDFSDDLVVWVIFFGSEGEVVNTNQEAKEN